MSSRDAAFYTLMAAFTGTVALAASIWAHWGWALPMAFFSGGYTMHVLDGIRRG